MSKLEPLPDIISHLYDDDSLVYYSDDKFFYNHKVRSDIIDDIESGNLQIYTGYYVYKKGWHSPKIFLLGRGKKSQKVKLKIENYLPYCYVNSKDGEYNSLYGDKVEKILFEGHPSIVRRFRIKLTELGFERPYEADIPFVRRFLIDSKILKPNDIISPKVGIIDIETNFPKDNTIISYALNVDGEIIFRSIFEYTYEELLNNLYNDIKDIDVLTGWNVKFDVDIIDKELSKVLYIDKNTSIVEDTCAVLDMMALTKKMYAREIKGSWSLDNAGRRFCGIGKIDLNNRYPSQLSFDELLEYNVMDVIIPEVINELFGCIPCHLILSWSTQCTLEDSVITAVVNDIEILRAYHRAKIVLPSRPEWTEKKSDRSYEAAKPLAREGKYDGILKFDVTHSYPWSVIAINASIETMDENGKYSSPNGVRFNSSKSTFIEELKKIMDERAKVKVLYKKYKKLYGPNHELTKKYKYIDFALKTQAAAFSHGIFGWKRSRMYAPDVAGAITSTARNLIFFAMRQADLIGYKWVYQHSVSPDTPLLLRNQLTGQVITAEIEELYDMLDARKFKVWSDNGWTDIKKVIRHKCDEQMYRIFTPRGSVDVTEYHSLLDKNAKPITPNEISIGTELLHKKYINNNNYSEMSKEEAWLMGLFMAEGSCNKYFYKAVKRTWAINNKDLSLLRKSQVILRKLGYDSKILDIMKSSGIYRLVLTKNKNHMHPFVEMVSKYRNLFYTKNGNKKVPDIILNSDKDIILSFLDGYNAGDGSKRGGLYLDKFKEFTTKSKIEALGLTVLLDKLGLDYSINRKSNGRSNKYFLIWIMSTGNKKGAKAREPYRVTDIMKIPKTNYVYDLETDNHHFHAGIGNMIVHNTDSIYINAPKEKSKEIINYFDDVITKYCNRNGYKLPAKLDFKDYYPMIYVHSPGRNVLLPDGVDIDDDEHWEVTGMNFYRSETPEVLANIEINLIKMIFKNKSKDEMLDYLRNELKGLKFIEPSKLGLIKPLNKKIEKYGRKGKNSEEIVGIPNHIKALLRAEREYGLKVSVGSKFMILPIITNETVGKRKIKRKRVDIAFLPEIGLPEDYRIDFESYLKSNLFGKINKMFGMSEKEIYEKCKDVVEELMYEK